MIRQSFLSISAMILLLSCQDPRDRSRTSYGFSIEKKSTLNEQSAKGADVVDSDVDEISILKDQYQKNLPLECSSYPGYKEKSAYLGNYNYCFIPSSNTFYLQLEDFSMEEWIAIFPLNTNSDKESIYIGNAISMSINTKNFYKFELKVNRKGYETETINSVIIMKDMLYYFPKPFDSNILTTEAFLQCSVHLIENDDRSYCETFQKIHQYLYISTFK